MRACRTDPLPPVKIHSHLSLEQLSESLICLGRWIWTAGCPRADLDYNLLENDLVVFTNVKAITRIVIALILIC